MRASRGALPVVVAILAAASAFAGDVTPPTVTAINPLPGATVPVTPPPRARGRAGRYDARVGYSVLIGSENVGGMTSASFGFMF